MSLIIPAGFAQASVILRNDGDPDPWSVTFGVTVDQPLSELPEKALCIAAAFRDSFLVSMNAATVLERVHMAVGTGSSDHYIYERTFGFPGSGATEKLPQNCALLVRKRSALTGRQGRGRMYIPNVLSDSVVNSVGVIQPSSVDAFQDVADLFLDALANPTEPFAIASPMVLLHSTPKSGTLPEPNSVTSLTIDSTISTQRRRLR